MVQGISPSRGDTSKYVLELFRDRGAEHGEDVRYAKYVYQIFESFPEEYYYEDVTTSASTNYDLSLRAFMDDYVWCKVVEKSVIEHRYVQIPSSAVGILLDREKSKRR